MEQKNKNLILKILQEKADTKQKIYDITLEVFNELKVVLKGLTAEINSELIGKVDERVLLEYKDKGAFETELKVAGDVLIFNMHTNVFDFPMDHNLRKFSYFYDNPTNSLSGIISVYNFLSDSFRFHRYDDLGYMIARIFINKDRHYFLEGKRQLGFLYNDYENETVDKAALRNILFSSILYTLDFDLLVPKYDDVSIVSAGQILDANNKTRIKTGKRLGFQFYPDSDDVEARKKKGIE
ncbi:MAG: hypothetical protein J7L46_01390 [Bacteroidales bacterium]|nr:hypothetical protein [Bacteroidales bacterium]